MGVGENCVQLSTNTEVHTILNRGANKTVGVGNRLGQGGVGGGKYVKGEQWQIYPIC